MGSLIEGQRSSGPRRHWTIERRAAWLGNDRGLVIRYQRKSKMFLVFLKVACLMIALRQL